MSGATAATVHRPVRRVRARVEGTVQGVGFRPYVYRLAGEHRLAGFVFNDSRGVVVEVEGSAAAVERFIARLGPEAPPLALVERVVEETREPTGERGFRISESPREGAIEAPVAADSATCEDCLGELRDSADRRFRYPFTNCTNCGPRFTIVRAIPYDRPFTTMAGFAMCELCRAEYEDPGDRRFHAQPNACPRCGPSVTLLGADGEPAPLGAARDGVAAAAGALRAGLIVAVKGLGGFHLACRADEERAVARLRARKHREERPFALMVATATAAGRLVRLGAEGRRLLERPERPIVLASRRAGAALAPSVAPGLIELGVMLPYSPLHHLLLDDLAGHGEALPLVMTSGNVSDEPIAYRDEDAIERLAAIADMLLVHDRPIETRTDDSVLRSIDTPAGTRGLMLRRSRGYVPQSLSLPTAADPPILACGGQLKNTFCLAKGSRAWVSHHIGDLENFATLCSFLDGVAHFERLFDARPGVLAHDLHPEYLSSKFAAERSGVELVGVQHHHAHLAACLAEHGEPGLAVGAIYDGSGHGPDGTVWGGELLVGDVGGFRRAGALTAVPLPGGERAVREPWRMACAWLSADCGEDLPEIPRVLRERVDHARWRKVAGLARSGLASPQTTSMGRLFDAVAAICGLRPLVGYEGQAAIELEAACDPFERGSYPIAVRGGEMIEIDPRVMIGAVSADAASGVPRSVIAARFHTAVAAATVRACALAASDAGTELVVLSGGVFQNRRLLEAVLEGLREAGLRGLVAERLPVGDGGISYGQAAVAARQRAVAGGG